MTINDGTTVTLRDVIHSGISLGLGMTRTLDIARELGFQVRDTAFAEQWAIERELFSTWRRQQSGK